jgi:hypothetical protein
MQKNPLIHIAKYVDTGKYISWATVESTFPAVSYGPCLVYVELEWQEK